MSRLARRIALQAHVEATYGAGLTGSQTWSNALQIPPLERPRHRIERMNEPANYYTPFLGAADELPGPRVQEIQFTVDLAASGTAGTAPPIGPLLRACQFAETVTAGARVEYTPVSEPGESLTIRYWEDGHAYIARGCRGTVSLDITAFKRPTATFTFRGFDTAGGEAAALTPANPYAAWRDPILPMSGNSGDILLGCTYAGGSLSGGTAYPSKGLKLDMGNQLTYDAILSAEKVVVTERSPRLDTVLELTAAQEVVWRTDMNDSVETTLGWRVGTTAGNRIVIFARRAQRQEAQGMDDNGFRRVEAKFGLILSRDDPNDDFMRLAFT